MNSHEAAFKIGGRIDPPYFVGREREIQILSRDAATMGQSNVVIAPRRFGKTALLFAVQANLSPGILAPYVSCLTTPDPIAFHDRVVEAVLDMYEAKFGRTRRFLATWRDVLSKPILATFERLEEIGGSIADIGSLRLKFRTREVNPIDLLAGTFDFLEQFATEQDERITLILDEFQELATFGDRIFPLFKAKMDAQRRVSYLFTGSSLALLSDVFGREGKSPLYQMVGRIHLCEICDTKAQAFVRERLHDTHHVTIDDDALRFLSALIGGIPYYVQKLGLLLERFVLLDERVRLTRDDVTRGFAQMLDELDADFLERWTTRFSDQQRTILRALAAEPAGSTTLARRIGVPAENLTYNLRKLCDEMILGKDGGAYHIVDRVFAAWLARW